MNFCQCANRRALQLFMQLNGARGAAFEWAWSGCQCGGVCTVVCVCVGAIKHNCPGGLFATHLSVLQSLQLFIFSGRKVLSISAIAQLAGRRLAFNHLFRYADSWLSRLTKCLGPIERNSINGKASGMAPSGCAPCLSCSGIYIYICICVNVCAAY